MFGKIGFNVCQYKFKCLALNAVYKIYTLFLNVCRVTTGILSVWCFIPCVLGDRLGFICNKELILKIAIKQKIPESLYYDDIF